jgi:hypothetical protein
MDVAIYLLDNGAAVDEAVSPRHTTALLAAVYYHNIDMIRMLLSRGASLDHFDEFGFDAGTLCLASAVVRIRHKTETKQSIPAFNRHMLNVISEFVLLDTNTEGRLGDLMKAAVCSDLFRGIDFLINLGYRVEDYGSIYSAALRGNTATYFSLLAHGATTERLEHELLVFVAVEANPSIWWLYKRQRRGISDPIIKNLLSQRADLMNTIKVTNNLGVMDIEGPPIPLQHAVAAYGPETEAWFLGLLQECGLESEEDSRRLQELGTGGYGQQGVVIGEVQEKSDDGRSDEDGERGQSSARSEAGGSRNEAEDTEEEDESFWDAEEGM